MLMKRRSNRDQLLRFAAAGAVLLAGTCWAADSRSDIDKRLEDSAKVLNEVMATPDKAIPLGELQHATCIAIFPSTVQVAALLGAKHGKGFATCRTSNGWSAPAPLDIRVGVGEPSWEERRST